MLISAFDVMKNPLVVANRAIDESASTIELSCCHFYIP